MSLIPYDYRDLENWRREIDKFIYPSFFFRSFPGPCVDVHETADEVIASCEIPGLEKKEDIQLQVNDKTLVIAGKINRTHEVKDEEMYRKERYTGSFQRAVNLPSSVSSEGTKATYKNGILEVRMPKVKNQRQQLINIDFH